MTRSHSVSFARTRHSVIRATRAMPRIAFAAYLHVRNLVSRRPVTAADRAQVDVSLTTYGRRLKSVHITIESIARGTELPDRIILWIDDAKALVDLPKPLVRLQSRGLEVRLSENFGPHTKYLPYALQESQPHTALVTADDDCLYPRNWLRDLIGAAKIRPGVIHAHRARVMTPSTKSEGLAPYLSWPEADDASASHTVFFMGVSGVIYPPIFVQRVRTEAPVFPADIRSADDIWLNLLALRWGYTAAQVSPVSKDYPLVPLSQSAALSHENLLGGGNDATLRRFYKEGDLASLFPRDAR